MGRNRVHAYSPWMFSFRHCFLFCLALLCSNWARSQHFGDMSTLDRDSLEKVMASQSVVLLKFNPLPMIWGPIPLTSEFRLGVEASTSSRISYQLTGSYLGKSPLFNLLMDSIPNFSADDFYLRGFRGQGQIKYFLLKPTYKRPVPNLEPEGWYISAHASYSSANLGLKGFKIPYIRMVHFNANALMGYQLRIVNGFYFDSFIGLGYKNNAWYEHTANGVRKVSLADLPPSYASSVKFSLGFNFGVDVF